MADRTWTGRLLFKGEDRGISKSAQKVETAVGKAANAMKRFGLVAAAVGAAALFVGSAKKIKEFEKSISDLSAITGAAGKDLDVLTEASKKIGQTTTLSASQAAEAFKLIASAKPDLIGFNDSLIQTTEAAVTLAEAAGLDLPTAATALGESLNQFGKGAEEAERFMNVLAAGAKFGSSEIAQTSEALRNAGTVAKLAGLSFETTNASIQALAAAGIKGSDAGTKLRSVLIKLQTQANDDFNPAVVGMTKALENMEDANLSITEKVAIFGERSVATADVLIAQREVLAKVEGQVTGTSEAYDQAAKRTDNLDGDIKKLTSAFEAFQINLGNKMLPVMRQVVQTFTDIFNAVAFLTNDEGIKKADDQFSVFDATLKTLFVTGSIIKNMLDNVFDSLVFIGRSLVDALSGNFDLIDDHFAEFQAKVQQNGEDIAQAAFRSFEPEAAAAIDAATESLRPKVVQQQEALAEAAAEVQVTAGMEAAAKAAELAAAKERKDFEDRERLLESIRESHRDEMEILIETDALKIAELELLLSEKLLTEEEFNQKFLDADDAFQAARLKITQKGATQVQKFEMLTAQNKTKFVLAEATKLTQGVAQNNKTMFKINKVSAIANAVINTGQAITRTMADYPYPVNIALAALTAAAGFAQIQSIKSTQFQGGGGGTTPSAAGSVPTLNNNPVGGANEVPIDALLSGQNGGGGGGQNITIDIDGLSQAGLLPADAVRGLISSINEQLGDGVNLNVDASESGGAQGG